MLRLIVPAFLAAAILVSVSARPASADMARDIIKDGTYVNVWPGQTLYCRRGYADYPRVTVLGWNSSQYSIQLSDGSYQWVYGDVLYQEGEANLAMGIEVGGPALILGCLLGLCDNGSQTYDSGSNSGYDDSGSGGYDPMEHQQACEHGACGPSQ